MFQYFKERTVSIIFIKGSKYVEACMAAINDTSFIIIGGAMWDNWSIGGNLTQIYNLETGTWTRMPDMEPGRYGPKCMNYMDGVMVAGGVFGGSGGTVSNDVNFFNLTTNKWQKFPSLNCYCKNCCRSDHILAPVNDIPTVIGGFSSDYSEQYINGKWNNWIEQNPKVYSHSFVQVPKDDFHC